MWVASKVEVHILWVVAPTLINLAVDGVGAVSGIGGKHLCGASCGRQKHRFHLQVLQAAHHCRCQRCLAGARIAVEQEGCAFIIVGNKLAECRHHLHLLLVGLIRQGGKYACPYFPLFLCHSDYKGSETHY